MSLSRAGRSAEAKAMLNRRPDSKPVTNASPRHLQLYRGEIGPETVVTSADTDDVQVATLAYGLGNWYLFRGDKAQARSWFERSNPVWRLARVRIHRVGGGAPPASLRPLAPCLIGSIFFIRWTWFRWWVAATRRLTRTCTG